ASNFQVEVAALGVVAFSEVSGIGAEVDVITFRSGGDITARKVPGLRKFSNVTLKRGMTRDLAVWQWFRQGGQGSPTPQDVIITLLDEAQQTVVRFLLRRAWPCRWAGPTLVAGESEVAVETVELCHEGLEVEAVDG